MLNRTKVILVTTLIICLISCKPKNQDAFNFEGQIQSTGLSENEINALGLQQGDYQLITTNQKTYFLNTELDLSQYWGNCVQLASSEIDYPESTTGFNYNRALLQVSNIKTKALSDCAYDLESTQSILDQQLASTPFPEELLNGTIVHSKRPVPDVAYDYAIKLTTPFIDNNHPSGEPFLTEMIWLVPYSKSLVENLEELITSGETKNLKGKKAGGFVESTIFILTEIK